MGHCVDPPIPYCPFRGPETVTIGLQCVAVKLFLIFLVTYSARLLFHFCVADLKAIQNVLNQPVPIFGQQDLPSKVRTFIFERVLFIPSEASKECQNFFVSSTLMKKNNNK